MTQISHNAHQISKNRATRVTLSPTVESVVGSIPSMQEGRLGHTALKEHFFYLLNRLNPSVFCDIGANKGEAGQWGKSLSPNSKVFGFEANPQIHARYQHANEKHGVEWVNLAICASDGEVELHVPRVLSRAFAGGEVFSKQTVESTTTGKSSLLLRDEDAQYTSYTVPSAKLDTFLSEHAPTGRVALWIDVEGAASVVLEGAAETLARTDLLMVEVEGYGFWKDQALADKILEALRAHGFVPILRDREYSDAQFNVLLLRGGKQLASLARSSVDLTESSELIGERPLPKLSHPVLSNTPVIVPCFNNPTYAQNMLEQLKLIGFQRITFVDNCSDSMEMKDWLREAEREGALVERLKSNLGPRQSVFTPERIAQLPRWFCVTDPDLSFNHGLPFDFLQNMAETMERFDAGKAGFALDISDKGSLRNEKFMIGTKHYTIWEWEQRFWKRRLGLTYAGDPVYLARVDTTFALYDRNALENTSRREALRIGGKYTATHLPWLKTSIVPESEARHYRQSQKYSNYDA